MQGWVLTMSSINHSMLRVNQFRLHYCPATTTKLKVLRPLHHGSLAARAPVVPLPRYRGGGWCERSRSRDTSCARDLPYQSHEAFACKKIKGRRSAGRRNCRVICATQSDVATCSRFGRGRASSGTRSPLGAPPRRSPRPCAEVRSRPRFTRCSAKALPPPWHRA